MEIRNISGCQEVHEFLQRTQLIFLVEKSALRVSASIHLKWYSILPLFDFWSVVVNLHFVYRVMKRCQKKLAKSVTEQRQIMFLVRQFELNVQSVLHNLYRLYDHNQQIN